MKIVLTAKEKAVLDNVAGMLGISQEDAPGAINVESENGNTTISVAEDYIVDISKYLTTVAPMLKSLYNYAKSTFENCVQLADLIDKKWTAPAEQKEAA